MKKGITIPGIILFNEGINTKEYKYAQNAVMNCDILFLIGTSGYFDYIGSLIDKCPGFIIEINPDRTRLTKKADISIREDAENIMPRLYNQVLINKILKEFRKDFESKNILSIYMYGSILRERRIPKDIDLLLVSGTEGIKIDKINEIKKRIWKLCRTKTDIKTIRIEELKNNINEYRKEVLNKGILLFGKNIRRDIIASM